MSPALRQFLLICAGIGAPGATVAAIVLWGQLLVWAVSAEDLETGAHLLGTALLMTLAAVAYWWLLLKLLRGWGRDHE